MYPDSEGDPSLEIKKEPQITIFSAAIAKHREKPESIQDSSSEGAGGIAIYDGMGGHVGGQKASLAAKEFFDPQLQTLKEKNPLEEAEDLAKKLQEAASKVNEATLDGGTTATVVKFVKHHNRLRAVIGHVGDSAAYLVRNNKVYKLTSEDTFWEEYHEDNPSEIKKIKKRVDSVVTPEDFQALSDLEKSYFARRQMLGQALRKGKEITPHIYFLTLKKGDRIIVGSDGLSDNFTEGMIEQVLQENPQNPAHTLAEAAYSYSKLHLSGVAVEDQPYPRAKRDDIRISIAQIDEAGEPLLTEGLSEKPAQLPPNNPEFIPLDGKLQIHLAKEPGIDLVVISAPELARLFKGMSPDTINTPYVLVDLDLFRKTQGQRGYTGLDFYNPLKVIGRTPSPKRLEDMFEFSNSISREHLAISLVGSEQFPEVCLEDLGSNNGTFIKT